MQFGGDISFFSPENRRKYIHYIVLTNAKLYCYGRWYMQLPLGFRRLTLSNSGISVDIREEVIFLIRIAPVVREQLFICCRNYFCSQRSFHVPVFSDLFYRIFSVCGLGLYGFSQFSISLLLTIFYGHLVGLFVDRKSLRGYMFASARNTITQKR